MRVCVRVLHKNCLNSHPIRGRPSIIHYGPGRRESKRGAGPRAGSSQQEQSQESPSHSRSHRQLHAGAWRAKDRSPESKSRLRKLNFSSRGVF